MDDQQLELLDGEDLAAVFGGAATSVADPNHPRAGMTATFGPDSGLRPEQQTNEQFLADLHARVNIQAEMKQALPWLTQSQAWDPKNVGAFMRLGAP